MKLSFDSSTPSRLPIQVASSWRSGGGPCGPPYCRARCRSSTLSITARVASATSSKGSSAGSGTPPARISSGTAGGAALAGSHERTAWERRESSLSWVGGLCTESVTRIPFFESSVIQAGLRHAIALNASLRVATEGRTARWTPCPRSLQTVPAVHHRNCWFELIERIERFPNLILAFECIAGCLIGDAAPGVGRRTLVAITTVCSAMRMFSDSIADCLTVCTVCSV